MLFFHDMTDELALAQQGHHQHGPSGQGSSGVSQQLKPAVSIVEQGEYRIISSNAIPNHAVGQFPNRGNPHTMSPQSLSLRVPMKPRLSAKPVVNSRGFFGVALNGVPFEPHTAEYWKNDRSTGWRMEVKSPRHSLGLDQNNAHVQSTGLYHYHGPPTGLMNGKAGKVGSKSMKQVGWAADGFPIYTAMGHADPKDAKSKVERLRSSWQLKKGTRPSPPAGPGGTPDGRYELDFEYVAGSGDLDQLNGREGVTPEFPEGTYYYVVTEEFPFLSREFQRGSRPELCSEGWPWRSWSRWRPRRERPTWTPWWSRRAWRAWWSSGA